MGVHETWRGWSRLHTINLWQIKLQVKIEQIFFAIFFGYIFSWRTVYAFFTGIDYVLNWNTYIEVSQKWFIPVLYQMLVFFTIHSFEKHSLRTNFNLSFNLAHLCAIIYLSLTYYIFSGDKHRKFIRVKFCDRWSTHC